jgi:hypothetical protein
MINNESNESKKVKLLNQLKSNFVDNFDEVYDFINLVLYKDLKQLMFYNSKTNNRDAIGNLDLIIEKSGINSFFDFLIESKKLIFKQYKDSLPDYEKDDPFSANIRFSWKKPDKTNGEIVLILSKYQRTHKKNDKDPFLSPEDVFIGNLDLIPLWNSYSGDYPTDTEKEELELKFKGMIKNLMVDAVKKQNEIAMSSLSLDEEGSKALYSNLRAGFVFYDLIDFDSIKDSNIVSKMRFLLLGLSKLEAIDLLEDCINEIKKE